MKEILIILILVSCSTSRGNLKKISSDKGIGVISFKVFNKQGEDISDQCIIRYTYGDEAYTQSYQLKDAPHFLELDSYVNVKRLTCMINLLVYKYDFDSFDFDIHSSDAYFFGEYYLEYDYKASYRETKFYEEAKKCEYDNNRTGYCGNSSDTWTNEGKLRLLKVERINVNVLSDEFPGHQKNIKNINDMKPRNVLNGM